MCAYTQPVHREARGTGTGAGAIARTAGAVTVSRGNFSVIMASPPFRARHWRTAIHAILKIRIVTTGGNVVVKTMFIPPRANRRDAYSARFCSSGPVSTASVETDLKAVKAFSVWPCLHTRTCVRFDGIAARTRTTPPRSVATYWQRSELKKD